MSDERFSDVLQSSHQTTSQKPRPGPSPGPSPTRMLNRQGVLGQSCDRVALKDDRLVYRACSTAFAHSIGCVSPDDIIGKTDFDLFPGDVARDQMALDSRTIYAAEADISTINLGPTADGMGSRYAMIVRTPVVGENNKVRGVDIRLLGGPAINTPRSAVSIDYQTLVNDGIQGSLILAKESILFANDNAARVLGYPSA
ncbi:MAG: PAS domain-containing protein, partial [Granulosicoccus sp.]